MRRQTAGAGALVLVGIVGVAGVVVATQGDEGRAAPVGGVVANGAFASDQTPDTLDEVVVQLPQGGLALRVGSVVEELPDGPGTDRPPVEAPEGGRFLPVAWQWSERTRRDDLGAVQGEPFGVAPGPAPAPALLLVEDGVRRPLAAPDPVSELGRPESAWFHVALAGADDVALVVALDGVEQTFDLSDDGLDPGDPGLLAGYEAYARDRGADGSPAEAAAVLPVTLGGGFRTTYAGDGPAEPGDGDLVVRVASREPYVTGLGWAPEGEVWAVLPLEVGFVGDVTDGTRDVLLVRSTWTLHDARPEIRVATGGGEPSPVDHYLPPVEGPFSYGAGGTVVVAVPADAAEVALTVAAEVVPVRVRGDEGAEPAGPVSLAWEGTAALS